jgi:Beta-galactosidase trimerisation domain/Cellulase (glycosyl hydrolase family 5)
VTFTVHNGRLRRDGQPFVATGVDYHPSTAGCRIWTEWDPDALRSDFTAIAGAGLNTVRFYVFWRDFEPEPGRYEAKMLARLRETVTIARDAGLACVVSLLTIWMNGQRLDLPWRRGRDLWRDGEMLARQSGFVRAAAEALCGLDNVLAFDLGDEIGNVDPAASAALSRPEVEAWHAWLAAAVREGMPGALVTQANDASGVLGPSPFGADNTAALDLVAVHAFPTWAPGSIESTLSYKATSLAGFLTRFAAAYGTPFVDELGSYGVDEATAAAYLRAAAASALANGAAGVAVWCWQDITSVEQPYAERPGERHVGLRRADGTAKPALAELRRLAAVAAELAGERRRARIAVYVPERERTTGSSYLDGDVGTVATFYAYLLLKRAHLDADVVAGDLDGYDLVFCPSVTKVTVTDLGRFRAHLDAGGVLYYSMGDHLHGFPGADLAGVELVDYSLLADGKSAIDWESDRWPLAWGTGPARPATVAARTSVPLAYFTDGTPALVEHRVGAGRMIFCAAPFERHLDRPGRLAVHPWELFYRHIADRAGVAPAVDCADPDVEIVPDRAPHPTRAVVVNHGTGRVRLELTWRDATGGRAATTPVALGGKDWLIVDREAHPDR